MAPPEKINSRHIIFAYLKQDGKQGFASISFVSWRVIFYILFNTYITGILRRLIQAQLFSF